MIVLFAHGSPDPRHRVGVELVADRVARLMAPYEVRVAYLQHHGPTLEAVAADADGEPVWVLPLLLSGGIHVAEDVPAAVLAAAVARPDVDWRVLPTLPPATLALAVLDLMPRPTRGGVEGSLGVVGVVAGSSRPGALAAFEQLAAALRPAGVELVIANGPGPAVAQAADLLDLLGVGQVVVMPLMFADGFLAERSAQTAEHLGLASTRPVGQAVAAAEAIAAWVTTHVRHTTHARPDRAYDLVDAAP